MKELLPPTVAFCRKIPLSAGCPTHDSEGNATVIRYSRKTKEQYVNGEKDGKATGFAAFYHNGKWVIEDKEKGQVIGLFYAKTALFS